MYKTVRNYENVQKCMFDGVGQYNVPAIAPEQYDGCSEWIGFNYAGKSIDRQHCRYITTTGNIGLVHTGRSTVSK